MPENVFFDRPGYRVTSCLITIGGQPIPTDQVYTAQARRTFAGRWSPRAWLNRLTGQPPRYELRMLTSAGRQAIPIGTDRELAETLAAAISRATRPAHCPAP